MRPALQLSHFRGGQSDNESGLRQGFGIDRFRALGMACTAISVALLAYPVALSFAAPQKAAVTVVTHQDVEAYGQTLNGIRQQMPDVAVMDAGNVEGMRTAFAKGPPALAIAIGSGAASALEGIAPGQLALIKSVVLDNDPSGGGVRFKTTVTIDVPADLLLAKVAQYFPSLRRVGLIRGPMQNDAYIRAFEQAAKRRGMTLEVVLCEHPRDLVEAFLKLRARADLVWCPPNPQLYNSATLKPLLVASFTNRLPILGYSEQFVQAGALFGGSPDYFEVGRQTAAVAARVLRNEAVPVREDARVFRFSYNQRVARMLGVKAVIPDRPETELTIIR
ncbi:MAG: ABC transporter substrate binding protein [Bryobacterales bacterium]|nr:ABC transporter substrate binding protein [Bryobacterales bacterium]